MKIRNQVTTLDQSKKLFDLGIKCADQAQYFWVDYSTHSGHEFVLSRPLLHGGQSWLIVEDDVSPEVQSLLDNDALSAGGPIYPAWTVAELGILLAEIDNGNIDATCFYNWHMGFWDCLIAKTAPTEEEIENGDNPVLNSDFECNTEAEVRGEALVWLIENKHILVEDCESLLRE